MIVVLAGSYRQYHLYLEQLRLTPKEVEETRFMHRVRDYHGLDKPVIHLYGTWYKMKYNDDILTIHRAKKLPYKHITSIMKKSDL